MDRGCLSVLAVFVVSGSLIAGCGDVKSPATDNAENSRKDDPVAGKNGNKPPKVPNPKIDRPQVKLKPFELPKDVTLKDVTPQELQAFIEKQKGHVVLVDYWAMWCEPCKKIFPHTAALGRKHAKDGLIVVSMCLDSLGNRERALKFLKSKDARLVNFFASEKLDPDMLTELFAVESLPYYRLYGPDGKLIQALKPGDKDEVKDFVPKLDAAVKEALGL